MRLLRTQFLLVIAAVSVIAAETKTTYFESLTTVHGTTYKHVTVTQIQGDAIQVRHSSGGGRIPFEELTDDTLKELGLPSKAEREEAQRRFEKEQQDKGLVKYEGKWVTPAEKEKSEKEKAYSAQADRIVMTRFLPKVHFKVIQSMSDGLLCVAGEWNSYFGTYFYSGDVFFLHGATSATVADREEFVGDLYWAGTYTYTTVKGVETTVNSYSPVRDLARRAVRVKFGLYDGKEQDSQPRETEARDTVLGSARSFGSGFFITENGYLISNNHVVRGAQAIRIKTESKLLDGKVVAQDPDNDIALIKVEGSFTPVRFSREKRGNMGQTIFTLGFPIPTLQGFNPKVTKGVISSLTGIRDNIRMYQIDAAVQPGNSGGPLADEKGNIVGVIVARLNESAALEETGALAQNVNYAVKQSYITALLDNYPDVSKGLKFSTEGETVSFEQAVERVRKSTVLVVVY